VRGLTGAEIAVRTTNTIEKGGKKATKEVGRECRRAAESQSGTTITVGALPPLAISISPESSPENGPPSAEPRRPLNPTRDAWITRSGV
jgi:hypothetical protein